MDAIHIELLDQMFDKLETNTSDELCVDGEEFVQALGRADYASPVAADGNTDSRFRLFLKVPGFPELGGVYYISGWHVNINQNNSRGIVCLSWDAEQGYIDPQRREAVMATRCKNTEIGG